MVTGVYWQVIFPQHVELALCLGRATLTLSEPGCNTSVGFFPPVPPTPLLTPHANLWREAGYPFAPLRRTAALKSKDKPKEDWRGQSQDTSGERVGHLQCSYALLETHQLLGPSENKTSPAVFALVKNRKVEKCFSLVLHKASWAHPKAPRNQWEDMHRHLQVAWSKQQPSSRAAKRITCQEKHWDTHAATFRLSNFMWRWEGTGGVKSFIP